MVEIELVLLLEISVLVHFVVDVLNYVHPLFLESARQVLVDHFCNPVSFNLGLDPFGSICLLVFVIDDLELTNEVLG